MRRLRFRIRLRSLMAMPILAGLALWLVGLVQGWGGQQSRDVGTRNIPLDFLVVDAGDGRPIPSAEIRYVEMLPTTVLTTGADGHARFVLQAIVAARRYSPIFGWSDNDSLEVDYPWPLEIKAAGYADQAERMGVLTRGWRYREGADPPPMVIRLKRQAARL